MKKQFFYAAFAIALMASCTNEENPVIDQPTPEEDKVAIELGVNTPNIVASRGTGTVGSVENDQTSTDGWNGQVLNIVMVNKDGTLVQETKENNSQAYIFENLTFKAPTGADGNIKIYADADKGVLQYKYYPVSGTFDFYGYHKDDATGGTESFTNTDAKVTGLTIDGTQDILAGTTVKLEDQYNAESLYATQEGTQLTEDNWDDMYKNQFSARTARNGITPILQFDHQLARLKFYVKSGNAENGAVYYKKDDNWEERSKTSVTIAEGRTHELHDGAIYITDIIAEDMASVIDIDLKTKTTTQNGTTVADFSLRSAPEVDADSKNLTDYLVPVAPMYPTGAKDEEGYVEKTPVGESMMFFPVTDKSDKEIILTLNLLQRVLNQALENDSETTDPKGEYPKYIEKKMTSQIKLTAPNSGKFVVGNSYDVFITIYSLEDIKISAQLTEWKDGGDVDVDIENNVYPEKNETPAP